MNKTMNAITAVVVGFLLTLGSIAVLYIGAADADMLTLTIPESINRGTPFTEVVFDTLDTGSLAGGTCEVRVTTSNNESMHDTWIVVTSGNRVQFDGVETIPNFDQTHTTALIVGPTITLSLGFGASGVSSAGFTAHLDCEPPVPPTTTAPPTTTEPPTEPPVVVPPPTTVPLSVTPPAVAVPAEPQFTG